MTKIMITVANILLPNHVEEFITYADITNLVELEQCANECCEQFLHMHGTEVRDYPLGVDWNDLVEACFYTIEEAPNEF